jgi:hypothetical protein
MKLEEFFGRYRGAIAAVVLVCVVGAVAYFLGSRSSTQTPSAASPAVATVPASAAVPAQPDTDLTKDSAASLVLAYSIAHCPPTPVRFDSQPDFPVLDQWVNGLLQNGYVLGYSGPSRVQPEADEEDFSYTYQDVSTTVLLNRYHRVSFKEYEFYACLAAPTSINILDTTIDPNGKSAVVIYTYGGTSETRFAADMMIRAQPTVAEPLKQALLSWTGEHTARLQRLDSTGWRVNSVQ